MENRLRILRIALAALLVTSATSAASAQSSALEVVRVQMDAYNRGDADSFLATYDDRAMLLDLRTGRATAIGKQSFGPLYRDMFARGCMDRFGRECPDLRAEAVSTLELGEFVVMHERLTLTEGEPPLDLMLVYEVREGRIWRVWSAWDEGQDDADLTTIDRQMAAYNDKDLEGFLEPYADDVELKLLSTGEIVAKGSGFLRGTYGERFTQASDLKAAMVEQIAVADMVANLERLTDGAGSTSLSIDVYRIVDGRILLVWFIIPR